ncbi:MAG TPA: TetR family transcriptional regulator [Actinocrinis sp.]|uniref:TetR family transcriptional regulator n=1 Tax=Actinocrinis sp. TaxID=1920516 RepID=UPI002D51AF17|nr:TetR family transcriptional regulator [Actinocrinis sp.]HZU54550.1 TetR family transcriptional regulator [Actinocrinis sp.]
MSHPHREKAGPAPADIRLGTLGAAFDVEAGAEDEAELETGATAEAGTAHASGTEVAAGVRQVRKQRTRQALLDSALQLLEQQSLSSLGLREVTRAAGIAPAAFYRHFPDIAALGVALVEESFGSLRAMVREIRAQGGDVDDVIGRSVDVIAEHVHEQPAHFRFLARERHGGVAAVRAAIAAELDGFVRDLVEDLSAQPDSTGWSANEIRILAELYVNHTMLTATAILEATTGEPRLGVEPTEVGGGVSAAGIETHAGTGTRQNEQAIVEAARMQLRLISLGRRHWLDERPHHQRPET